MAFGFNPCARTLVVASSDIRRVPFDRQTSFARCRARACAAGRPTTSDDEVAEILIENAVGGRDRPPRRLLVFIRLD